MPGGVKQSMATRTTKPDSKQCDSKAAQTRQKLLDSAFALFSERGFYNVTVEEITKSAGVSKGTFYFYFSAKEAVLTEYFLEIDELYARTYQKLSRRLPTEKKLMRMVDVMCSFCQNRCGVAFLRIIYANQLLHDKTDVSFLYDPERKIRPILREIAKDGKAAGEIPESIDNETFAGEVMHLAHGIVYDWCAENGRFDLKKEGRRVFGQMFRMANAFNEQTQ